MDAINTIDDHERHARCIQSSKEVRWDINKDVIRERLFDTATKFLPDSLSLADEFTTLSANEKRALRCAFRQQGGPMKDTIDARDESKDRYSKRELTEDRFLEQFAALEESLVLLQAHMHSMSENAKLFGSLARHIRRSTCPTTGHQDKIRADCGLGQVDHI